MFTTDENPTVIHCYTRADALADGELIDTDSLEVGIARQAGFVIPVAFTRAAWLDCVHWDDQIEASKPHATGQDSKGRLWDVLNMAKVAARGVTGDRALVPLLRVPGTGSRYTPDVATLRLQIGPGDQAEPVVTLMLPEED